MNKTQEEDTLAAFVQGIEADTHIQRVRKLPESHCLEFKEQFPKQGHNIGTLLSAFANHKGGDIYFGIQDKTRDIIGIENGQQIEERVTGVRNKLDPIPYVAYTVYTILNGQLLVRAHVAKSDKPVAYEGRYYYRDLNSSKTRILTTAELEKKFYELDFKPYLDHLIERFEKMDISKYYINLKAQNNKETQFDLDSYIQNWINNDSVTLISILGEYGTGKTSFCRKLAHDLAKRYKKDHLNTRIPLLIRLQDYSKVVNVRRLIKDLLIDEYELKELDLHLFEKMNQSGRFILIFDGFDEMEQEVRFDVAYGNFSMIAELAKPPKSKVLLTCRTEFFRTYEKEREILQNFDGQRNLRVIYLKEFTNEQIKEFLEKRVPLIDKQQNWEYLYKKIKEISDLEDLATRPVLLDLIIRYLPEVIKQGDINAATLYRTCINMELKRKITTKKAIISKEDRINLIKALAMRMYNTGSQTVHFKDITTLLDLEKRFVLKSKPEIEYHLHDFFSYSFLNRDSQGNYRFSHNSFIDFLVAWAFVDNIANNFNENFLQKPITYEVKRFMKDLEIKIKEDRLYNWIELTKGKTFAETKYLGANSIALLHVLGDNFVNKKVDFSETVLDFANFSKMDLTGLNFQNASLEKADFRFAILRNTNFAFTNLKDAYVGERDLYTSVSWNPAGNRIASVGQGLVTIWDVNSAKKVIELDNTVYVEYEEWSGQIGRINLPDSFYCVCWSPDGKCLITGSAEGRIRIWDAQTYTEKDQFEYDEPIFRIVTDETFTHLILLLGLTKIGIYDLGNKKMLNQSLDLNIPDIEKEMKISTTIVKGAISGRIAVGRPYFYNELIVWNFINNEIIRKKFSDTLYDLIYFGEKICILLTSSEEALEVKLISTDNFTMVKRKSFHDKQIWPGITKSSYSKKMNLLFLGGSDSSKLILPNDDVLLLDAGGYAADFSPDGKRLAISALNEIQIWDTNEKNETFGKLKNKMRYYRRCIDAKGMNIQGVKGLDSWDLQHLKKSGAIEN